MIPDKRKGSSASRQTDARLRPVLAIAFLLALLLTAVAGRLALSTLETPFPGLFVDPFAAYSAVSLPSWQALPVPLA